MNNTKETKVLTHCGAKEVSWEEVCAVVTPEATDKWTPIPHHELVTTVKDILLAQGQRIAKEQHTLSREGARYFGVLHLVNRTPDRDFALVLGIRNSHDKSFAASVCAGSSVFVCDNLAFNGEVRLDRMHTKNILRDLPKLTAAVMGQLQEIWVKEEQRVERYKNTTLIDAEGNQLPIVNDLMIRAMDMGAITPMMLPKVLRAWRLPEHEQFKPRNVWSLYNAFTGVTGEQSLELIAKRTTALNGLFDNVLAAAEKDRNDKAAAQ